MTDIADYAVYFETRVRPRRLSLKRALAWAVWAGVFVVRPALALSIWRERRV